MTLPSLPSEMKQQIPWTTHDFGPLLPARTALLVVDMQNAFMLPGYSLEMPNARKIVPNINRLIAAFRGRGAAVVFLRHTVTEETEMRVPDWQYPSPEIRERAKEELGAGSAGNSLSAELDIDPEQDYVIRKYRPSAFSPGASNTDSVLRHREIDSLVVVGTATNVCCESTARDANMLGYKVYVVADATATASDYLHRASLVSMGYFFARIAWCAEIISELRDGHPPST